MKSNSNSCVLNVCFVIVFALPTTSSLAVAESISLHPVQDATLYEFDATDSESPFNANGAGDFISAGRSRSRGLLRRGLLKFDFSTLPTGAHVVPGSLRLDLEVVDAPSRDNSGSARDFWLVPVQQAWGEGTSAANAGVSGAGSGAAATAGDATWLHTDFDPVVHDPRAPNPTSETGYWTESGVVGNAPVDPTQYGAPAGTVPAAPYLGPVSFMNDSIGKDINAWLAGRTANHGWLVLGDERITDSNESSNRGFASREHATLAPTLTFEYTVVPEPSTAMLLLGITACCCVRRRIGSAA